MKYVIRYTASILHVDRSKMYLHSVPLVGWMDGWLCQVLKMSASVPPNCSCTIYHLFYSLLLSHLFRARCTFQIWKFSIFLFHFLIEVTSHFTPLCQSIRASVHCRPSWPPVRPDWAIFCTLGNFFKPLATINLPKSLTFLGNFCKGVNIYQFSSEIIFGQLLQTFGDFYLVTLTYT